MSIGDYVNCPSDMFSISFGKRVFQLKLHSCFSSPDYPIRALIKVLRLSDDAKLSVKWDFNILICHRDEWELRPKRLIHISQPKIIRHKRAKWIICGPKVPNKRQNYLLTASHELIHHREKRAVDSGELFYGNWSLMNYYRQSIEGLSELRIALHWRGWKYREPPLLREIMGFN